MKNNKGVAPILIVLIIVGVLALGGGTYYFLVKKTPKPVTCTQEVKLCPDGSAVSRIGPNCEFAECPAVKADETADWEIFKNETYKYEIKYPEELSILDYSDDTSVLFVKKPEMKITDFDIAVVVEPKKYTSMEDYFSSWEEKFREEIDSGKIRILKEKVNIGGQKRNKITVLDLTDNSILFTGIILFKEGNIIVAHQLYPKECESLECEIFNQILSTFRFLD